MVVDASRANMGIIKNYTSNVLFALYTVIYVYSLAAFHIVKQFLFTHRKFDIDGYGKRKGDVCIVTGGMVGIGLEITKKLLKAEFHVIAVALPQGKEADTLKDLRRDYPSGIVEYHEMDLGSLKSIKNFVEKFLQRKLSLHILINNAGVMMPPYFVTESGFELQYGVNYIGHFYLTWLLLARLKETGQSYKMSRIVNVSSCCHYCGRINFNDINSRNFYSSHASYAQSKLAIVMWTKILNAHFEETKKYVRVNAVHPGVVNTDLYQYTKISYPFIMKLLLTPEQGADSPLHVALSEELEGMGGYYFENSKIVRPNAVSEIQSLQETLWKLTLKQLGLDDFMLS